MKKLSQQQVANILKVVLIVGWLFLMNSLMSCSSTHYRNKVKEKTQKITSNKPQYAFYNNQIVIFENN